MNLDPRRAPRALLHIVQRARVLAWRSQWRARVVVGKPRLTQPALLLGQGTITFEENVGLDNNFRGRRGEDRRRSRKEDAAPVVIEDDVFIGSSERILKGATIGRGAVVAGSPAASVLELRP